MFAAPVHLSSEPESTPAFASLVAALCSPTAYPEGPDKVQVIETHRAWVFLTGRHAYKLAKSSDGLLSDAAWVQWRRERCQAEMDLNLRLAENVYLCVVPVARAGQRFQLEGPGPAADFVLKMRRLPRHLMLDEAILDRRVSPAQIDALARRLARFHATAVPAPRTGAAYRQRFTNDIDSKRASLAREDYCVSWAALERLVRDLRSWLAQSGELLESRANAIVDAHGDLRPEHICLEPEPVVIDCLEFDRELRLLDPLSEVAFLALECTRLGAAWVGAQLLSPMTQPLGHSGDALVSFYQGYHALVRAAVSIWHLDDPARANRKDWKRRCEAYLQLGAELLESGRASAR